MLNNIQKNGISEVSSVIPERFVLFLINLNINLKGKGGYCENNIYIISVLGNQQKITI